MKIKNIDKVYEKLLEYSQKNNIKIHSFDFEYVGSAVIRKSGVMAIGLCPDIFNNKLVAAWWIAQGIICLKNNFIYRLKDYNRLRKTPTFIKQMEEIRRQTKN